MVLITFPCRIWVHLHFQQIGALTIVKSEDATPLLSIRPHCFPLLSNRIYRGTGGSRVARLTRGTLTTLTTPYLPRERAWPGLIHGPPGVARGRGQPSALRSDAPRRCEFVCAAGGCTKVDNIDKVDKAVFTVLCDQTVLCGQPVEKSAEQQAGIEAVSTVRPGSDRNGA